MIKKENIDSSTGLRGIATLFVVITHYSAWVAPYKTGTVPYSINLKAHSMGIQISMLVGIPK